MRGWVYVFSNKAMPGLVKIGFTMKDPMLRADELRSTGIPFPFEMEYEALVHEPQEIETVVHSKLSDVRTSGEFFKCAPDHAAKVIRESIQRHRIFENDYTKNSRDPDLSLLNMSDKDKAARELEIEYLKKNGMWG